MFLNKIKAGESGILTYGITPPKSETAPEKIAQIAERTIARLLPLNLDVLIVYDVQDEASRTDAERPFPFLKALDPFEFASQYLQPLEIPKIIYRPAGKFSKEELSAWLDDLHQCRFYPVFVGIPVPGFSVKTTLHEAYQLWRKHENNSAVGAITIPERHAVLKDEDMRMLDKMSRGVSYFISQCVFNVDYAKKVVEDLCHTCEKQRIAPPAIIFTLTVCGSIKTLRFMEWLGIHIPGALRAELEESENMLERSVQVCLANAAELTAYCAKHCVPFGFNIESVAIRKDEIEASVAMVNQLAEMLEQKGIRKTAHGETRKQILSQVPGAL